MAVMSGHPAILANSRSDVEGQTRRASKHALFRLILRTTTNLVSAYEIASRAFAWSGDERPFETPAANARRYRFVQQQELRTALAQFCADIGIDDSESVEHLSRSRVLHTSLQAFLAKRKYYAPQPGRDRLGHAASAFMAAENLPMLFEVGSAVGGQAIKVPLVARVMERGARGLFDLGRDQFDSLARMTVELLDWLDGQTAREIVAIESPLGNSVPIAVLREVAAARGVRISVVEWGCPRNDRALRGQTVLDSARDLHCDPQVQAADLLLFIDDAITGSRFLKMATALRKVAGADRVAAIALRARFNPSAGYPKGKLRSLDKVMRWASDQGMPFGEWILPDLPIFKIDEQAPALFESALAWGDAALTAGKRKANIVFYFIDRYEAITRDLGAPGRSRSREFLTRQLWNEDASGRRFATPAAIAEAAFVKVIGKLPQDFFASVRAAARQAFPHDFFGRPIGGKEQFRLRTDWLGDCIYLAARPILSEEEARFLNRAIQDLSSAEWTAGVDRPPRDHDYGLYTVPLPPGEDLLHQKLVELIVAATVTLAP